jgi:hypothetical protein
MRALRMFVMGLCAALLLGGVISCDEGDGRRITLEITEVLEDGTGTWRFEGDQGDKIDSMSQAIVDASDPRLSGTWTVVESCRGGFRQGFEELEELCVGSVRVDNAGGTWLGAHQGYRREGIDNLAPIVLAGQGDYAGLTAVLDYVQHHGPSTGKGIAGDGYIVDFEMPDAPEPLTD